MDVEFDDPDRCPTCRNPLKGATTCKVCGHRIGDELRPSVDHGERHLSSSGPTWFPTSPVGWTVWAVIVAAGAITIGARNEAAKTPDPALQRDRENRRENQEMFRECVRGGYMTTQECAEEHPPYGR